ncbi:MAG: T9SS C-terminal target domain-containing protein, partial [Bacteroidetes bacterium]
YTPLSTNSIDNQNIISALGADLQNNTGGSVTRRMVGNEIVVQWRNVRRYTSAGLTESLNFQIRMNTLTGVINIVYGAFTSVANENITAQVGLRGANETWRTQVLNRENNLSWDKTTMGTNNTSALPLTNANRPASGLTFTYTPNSCSPFPIIGTVTQSGTNVTLNWTTQAEATNGYDIRYRLQSASIATYAVVNVPLQATNNVVISGLGVGTYIFEVRTRCSGSSFSEYSNAVVFNVLGNYYLKTSGIITNLADWGTNTDGTGTNPTALTQTNTAWNIRNTTNISNATSWTLGAGAKIVVGDGTNATNFTLPVGSNVIGTIDVNNMGTLTLQDAINPTFGTLAIGSTIDYNGINAQTIALANYSNLTISGARIGSPTIELPVGTIHISNNFTVTTTGVGIYANTDNTINFSGVGMQTIPAFSYYNITNTGNGNRTLATNGEINIAGTFATGTGTYTTTGSTVNHSATIGTILLESFNYYNIIMSSTTNALFSIGAGNTMSVANDFTLSGECSFEVNNTTGNINLSIGNDLNISNGSFVVMRGNTTPSTTLNITRDLNISGNGNLTLEFDATSNTAIATINVGRNFTSTSTLNPTLEFGYGDATGNSIRIGGNFSKSGTGRFQTVSSNTSLGFVFNGTGTQTFSYSGIDSDFTQYQVNAGATVQMLTGLALGGFNGLPISKFTVSSGGTLDLNTQVIGANDPNIPLFILESGANIKTANVFGLNSNFSNFTAGTTLLLNSGANYEFNANVAQETSEFITTPIANRVNNLTINNATNTSSTGVTLSANLTLGGVLNLTSGKLTTGNNTLTLQAGSGAVSPSLGKSSSYVVGNVSISADTDAQTLLFPMGSDTWWSPAKLITNGGAGNTTFNVKYNSTAHPFNSEPFPSTPEPITKVIDAYWDIDRSVGTRNANIQLYWNNNLGQITDRTKLRLLHGNAMAWENFGVDNTNGNASDGTAGSNIQGSIIKNAVSVFSPFTIGFTNNTSLPLNLLSFNATRQNNEKINLAWQTANEVDLKYFVIEKSTDAINFIELGKIDARNPSLQPKNYAFIDTEKNNSYYRLRFVHHTSPDEFSFIRFVKGSEENFVLIYPNPLQGKINFEVSENLKQNKDITLQVVDNQGKIIANFVGNWQKITDEISQTYQNWAIGLYFWNIKPKGEKKHTIKVIKE